MPGIDCKGLDFDYKREWEAESKEQQRRKVRPELY